MNAGVRSFNDLEYVVAGESNLCLDIHRPASDVEVPCVAYFHGGGWARGSRKDNLEARLKLVAAQGLAVASVSYRFTDTATYPAQLEDGRMALTWLRAHGSEFGCRTDRIGAWGASAGGWIALMLALTGEDAQRADAVCAWFPPTDLPAIARQRAAAALAKPSFLADREIPNVEAALLGVESLEDAPELARAASPLTHAAAARSPVLLIHGDADGLIDAAQSVALHEAVLAAGGDSQLLLIAGANHEDPGFQTPAVLAATAGFLQGAL